MDRRQQVIIVLASVLIIAAVIAIVSYTGGNDEDKENGNAMGILNKSIGVMRGLKTFSFNSTFVMGSYNTGYRHVGIQGYVDVAGRTGKMITKSDAGDEVSYIKENVAYKKQFGRWVGEATPDYLLMAEGGYAGRLGNMTKKSEDAVIDGAQYYRVTLSDEDTEIVYFIKKDTYHIAREHIKTSIREGNAVISIEGETYFYDFDMPLNITLPKELDLVDIGGMI